MLQKETPLNGHLAPAGMFMFPSACAGIGSGAGATAVTGDFDLTWLVIDFFLPRAPPSGDPEATLN
eukprot:3541301-Rhodomonas_salina.1